jgi:hypothetical protein
MAPIFVSGGGITPQTKAFLAAVPNLRVEKPFSVATLRETVDTLLSRLSAADDTA